MTVRLVCALALRCLIIGLIVSAAALLCEDGRQTAFASAFSTAWGR